MLHLIGRPQLEQAKHISIIPGHSGKAGDPGNLKNNIRGWVKSFLKAHAFNSGFWNYLFTTKRALRRAGDSPAVPRSLSK